MPRTKAPPAPAVVEQGDQEIVWLRREQLVPYPGLNPRQLFDPEEIKELHDSIAQNGVLQNLVVHETGEAVKWIVAGESRWRACEGLDVLIPSRLRKFTELQALKIAMHENLDRNNLRPTEQAAGFRHMLELDPTLTQEDLAAEYGKSQEWVSNRIRLLELPDLIRALVDNGTIKPSYARDFLCTWAADEKNGERFFSIVAQQILGRPDRDEPVARAWLTAVVEKLSAILKPQKAAAVPAAKSKPAPAPAPAPAKPAPAAKAPAPKAKAPAPAPVPAPAAAAAPSRPETRCIKCGCTEDNACEGGCSWTVCDFTKGIGVCSRCEPDASIANVLMMNYRAGDFAASPALTGSSEVAAPRDEPAPAASEEPALTSRPAPPEAEPAAEPEAAPALPALTGFFAPLIPLLDTHVVVLTLARPAAGGDVMITLAPRQLEGGQPIAPLVITRAPAALDGTEVPELAPYIADVPPAPAKVKAAAQQPAML